jgi:type VI secretion system protein
MALRLRVLGTKAERLGDRWSRVFGVHGGTIGRSSDCDWSLPDPQRWLSGHHAMIEYRGGIWYVVDTSMNGTFVNGATAALGRGRSLALRDGDQLRIGEYELLVSITAENDFAPAVAALGGEGTMDFAVATHGDIGADLDMKSLLASPIPPPDDPPPVRPGLELMGASDAYGQAVDVPYGRPRPAAPPVEIAPPVAPAAEAPVPAAPDPLPPVVPPALAAAAAGAAAPRAADPGAPIGALTPLQAFCRGAGIDHAKLPDQDAPLVLALAGQMLREFALGLMLGLRHRAEQRHAIRASQTVITPVANNPFKTARSVEEALQRLFGARTQRFLPPVEAIRAGFGDLQRHEQATLAAVQEALGDYLTRFAPDQLEEQFDRSLSRGPLPGAPDAGRYWELYAELFRVLSHTGGDGLPHAFSEAFAEAYARHEETLREAREEKDASRGTRGG